MKNANRLSPKSKIHNTTKNSSTNHQIFNPENSSIKQDLLFFKNDILKDLRKIEEKLNIKLTEQSVSNNDQYEACEKKLDIINSKIIRVNNFVTDNSDISEKINSFQSFKSKTEDSILSLDSRMDIIQKESKESIFKMEKIIEDNLKYPGIIGPNSKYANFRFFIDFLLKNINLLNDFKNEMKNYDFTGFKKTVNSDLREFRFVLNENNRNLRKLLELNIKEFNCKINDLNQKIDKKFEDIDNKIRDYKSTLSERLSLNEEKVENKFNILYNNIEDKYKEQLNEINNVKNLNNKSNEDINNVKNNLSKLEKSFNILKYSSENKIFLGDNIDSNQLKNFLMEKNQISNLQMNMKDFVNIDSNIQIYDNNMQNYEEKTNSVNTLENLTHNKVNLIDHYNSFNNSQNNDMNLKQNYYSDENNEVRSRKGKFDELNNDKEKNNYNSDLKKPMILNKYTNFKKAIFQNNYSIMNIPNIKIAKVIIPENINYYKRIRTSKSSAFDKRKKRVMSNNPSISKKYYLQNTDNLNINRNSMTNLDNLKEITKIKNTKNKREKGKKYIQSAKIIGHRSAQNQTDDVNSLLAIKTSTKNSFLNSYDNSKKSQTRSLSLENNKKTKDEKAGKDEKIQIEFQKTFNDKNKFKELFLVNAKNLKKNRIIKM